MQVLPVSPLLATGVLLMMLAVQAQEAAAAVTASDATSGEMLLLDATLNGTPTHQLLTLRRLPDGSFIARASELQALRIRIDPKLVQDDNVTLAALSGLTFRYDEASQSIALQASDALLQAYQVGLDDGRTPVDLEAIKPTPGAILNYGLYATQGSGRTALSGTAELIGMTPYGIVSTNGVFNTDRRYGGQNVVRLDSSWRYIDPRSVRSYIVGDFASNALAWTSSVRLAGFQIASAFEQRSDIVTTALPQFSGSAALPSTLDLYVNQQRIFSGEIPSGPFDVRSLPSISGGDVRLVTTDATGRQVELKKSYYYVPGQLRTGLLEFSLDVGVPRLDYGIRSFSYDSTVFGSGSVRYGLNRSTTLEGHAELSSGGLANAGVGIVQSIGGSGAISASAAASSYKSDTGAKFSVQAEGDLAGIRFYAGTERTIGTYFDLARVSTLRNLSRTGAPSGSFTDLLASTARATAIDRAGISFIPWFDRTSINLSYNAITSPGYRQRIASLALSRAINERATFYANGYVDVSRTRNYGLFGTITVRIGRSTTVTAGVSHDTGRTAYTVSAEGLAGQRQGDVGWGVSDREVSGGDDQRSAYVSYRAAEALIRARVDQSGSAWRGSLDVEGSLIAAGGGLFPANRIGNGFVIVKNAGPGAEVIQGGVRMGKANGSGKALLPDVQPYYSQQIFIDPATLPDGWEAASTEKVAITGYRQGAVVDFGAKLVRSAVLILHTRDGKPVPPGYTLQLEGGESALVGYDGEAYVRGLGPTNRLSIDLGPAGTCAASFAYDAQGPAQPRIGPVTCQ
ncbi:MAG: fimbria/pilus outer membrane usher protein [Pseudomonadota bacterium]